MIDLLITIVVYCIVFGVLWYIVSLLPLPEPFGQIARIAVLLIFCLILISLLLGIAGTGLHLNLRGL